MASIGEGIKYSFRKFGRLFYWLWALIPFFGWLAYSGYMLRISHEVINGNKNEAPKFGSFWENFIRGFLLTILSSVYFIVYTGVSILYMFISPVISFVISFLVGFFMSMLLGVMVLQYAENYRFADAFRIKRALQILFSNFGTYIVTMLKAFVVMLAFMVMSIPVITLLFTMSGMFYSIGCLWGDWYRNAKKPRN